MSGARNEVLEAAIRRLRRKSSYYWLFRNPDGLDLKAPHEVEARIDLPEAIVADASVAGWRVAHRDTARGMLFVRREQPLTDAAIRAMFVELLTFAFEHGGKFHSWMHAPDLRDR